MLLITPILIDKKSELSSRQSTSLNLLKLNIEMFIFFWGHFRPYAGHPHSISIKSVVFKSVRIVGTARTAHTKKSDHVTETEVVGLRTAHQDEQ